jgi:hypothetical protein
VSAAVLSSIASAVATVLLAALLRQLAAIRRDAKRFMAEHLWLLATTDWARTSIMQIMRELGLNGDKPPDWPGMKR